MQHTSKRTQPARILLAITGASGIQYGLTLLQTLVTDPDLEAHVIISPAAATILKLEAGLEVNDLLAPGVKVHDHRDMAAPPASGSWQHQGMVVCPCSMSSLASISSGCGYNLIHRAADVSLKEKRPLILVPRETPLNHIHLDNMSCLARAGATIMPACPGFYHRPASLQELINQLVGRILDHLGVAHALSPRWGEGQLPSM